MEWRRINYGTAESDEGATVSRAGFRSLTYSREGRTISIDVEPGDDDLGVYARSIDAWDDGQAITVDGRDVVLSHIQDALRLLRVPFKILWK